MSSVGIRELRQQASAVLRRVVAGESIDVTEHGRPIARLVPLQQGALDQLLAEGRATPVTRDMLDTIVELGLPARNACPTSPVTSLLELRAEEQ